MVASEPLERIVLILEIDYLCKEKQRNHDQWKRDRPSISPDATKFDGRYHDDQSWYDHQIASREVKLGLIP